MAAFNEMDVAVEGSPARTTANRQPSSSSSTSSSSSSPLHHHHAATNAHNNNTPPSSSSVQVAVRVRPMLASEAGSTTCIEVLHQQQQYVGSNRTSVVRIGGAAGPAFTFDEVFAATDTQEQVFENRVVPLLRNCLEGYNATIVAYGQTGSGKTFTIMGPSSASAIQDEEAKMGIIPRAVRYLFDELDLLVRQQQQQPDNELQQEGAPDEASGNSSNSNTTPQPKVEYDIRVQFLELYGEEIRDLLTPKPSSERLIIRDVGMEEPEVMGASQQKVGSAEEALLCLTRGMLRRVTGATAMNASSSRSHAILSVMVEQSILMDEDNPSSPESSNNVQVKRSKFNFVDLAGSERQKRTQAEGQRLKEGIDINKGLLVLGNVISALGDPSKCGKSFVPYRDSKLTRLLKGSLGGNHKTLMIACISPSSDNMEETLNCLRYANRAKNIQNHAVVNVDTNTRLLSELKGQVQALASDLLRARQGDLSNNTFTDEMLQAMISSGGSHIIPTTPTTANALHVAPSFTPNKTLSSSATPLLTRHAGDSGSEQGEEIGHVRNLLKQSRADLKDKEEELSVSRAENELQRLQLIALTGDSSTSSVADIEKDLFLQKAKEYEKEIAVLKDHLRTVKSQSAVWDEAVDFAEVVKASREIEQERAQLIDIQHVLSSTPKSESCVQDVEVLDAMSHLEAEENAENAEVSALTTKYLGDFIDLDEDVDAAVLESQESSEEQLEALETSGRRRQQLEAHLVDLSKRIDAKEELIQQLQISQERYTSMRAFYEDKLRLMEEQVDARERERELLVEELKRLVDSNSCTKDLEQRLQDKERHIAELRKRQRELVDFTKVSSRNESEIVRLRRDVVDMKQRKVDLQKQVNQERKQHAHEIQRLKKEAMQKDSELNKWKKASSHLESEKQKAQQMAKARMEQLGQLRAKYKDAEKRLRMFSVKRGVMAKAGLDPVLVGRRESRKPTSTLEVKGSHRGQISSLSNTTTTTTTSAGDVDAMRDFFDQEVARISQQEALIDKLAHEWESHLELVSRKEELLRHAGENTSICSEEIDALDLQRQYKEGRIRQMVRRLGQKLVRPSTTSNDTAATTSQKTDSFLNDADMLKFCPGASALTAAKMAVKVLFGMVVRERRRVAALARTASSLDDKAQKAEQAVAATEAAFRSYVEEQRDELALITQNHQEQILSLMTMLREESPPGPPNDSKLAVFANERIAALESQLCELRGEQDAKNMYKRQHEEAIRSLKAKKEETDELQKKIDHMRSAIRKIRDAVSRRNKSDLDGEKLGQWILSILTDALHAKPSPKPETNAPRRNSLDTCDSGGATNVPKSPPPLVKNVGRTQSSESDLSEELPDWAGDIMADLELIAQGKMPPSLRNSSLIKTAEQHFEKGTVFERLADPTNFTGVQKRKKTTTSSPLPTSTRPKPESKQHTGHVQPKAISRSNEKRTEKVAANPKATRRLKNQGLASVSGSSDDAEASAASDLTLSSKSKERRTVFDRLLSPSSYTGTHKGKVLRQQLQNQQQHQLQQNQQQQNHHHQQQHHQQQQQHHQQEQQLLPPPIIHRERIEVSSFSEDKDDELLDELLASSDDAYSSRYNSDAEHGRTSKGADYTQQNVFERLQRTTTQSYEVKKNPSSLRHPSDSSHPSPPHSSIAQAPPPTISIEPALTVQKSRENLSPQENCSNYTSLNVFERLQKTTTQAYAQKQHPSVEHNPAITK